jgi:hypothetical protein
MFLGKPCFLMSLSRRTSFRSRRLKFNIFDFLDHTLLIVQLYLHVRMLGFTLD